MMRPLSLNELRPLLGAELLGSDVEVSRVSTDTRSILAGDLFLALRGERFDGHDYIAEAQAKGAVAVVAEEVRDASVPVLKVADTRRALGQIAAFNRSLFSGPLVAVTGSNGKTTVKELLRRIFLQQGPVLATQGNLNNEIGAPLTLLQLAPGHAAAMIELGASGPGEIAWTASLAAPWVSILTNAGEAHMKGFGSYDGLVSAKGEIIDATAPDGTVVLNFDDPACGKWRARAGARKVTTVSAQGNAAADIRAEAVTETATGLTFDAHWASGETLSVQLPLIGLHNVSNALLVIAAATAVGISAETIRLGLSAAEPVKGRMQVINLTPSLKVIDDSYNANPTAMRAALRSLAGRDGLTVAALGDMAELGPDEETQHREIGVLARELGVDRLYVTGSYAEAYVAGYGPGATVAQSHAELVDKLWTELENIRPEDGATVLAKGSRSAAMDQVVALLNKKVNP